MSPPPLNLSVKDAIENLIPIFVVTVALLLSLYFFRSEHCTVLCTFLGRSTF
jgi:hypothetical protein